MTIITDTAATMDALFAALTDGTTGGGVYCATGSYALASDGRAAVEYPFSVEDEEELKALAGAGVTYLDAGLPDDWSV